MWNWRLIIRPPSHSCAKRMGDVTVAYPYKSYFAGTVAYLIKKSAARAFLKTDSNKKNRFGWLMISYYLKPNSRLITMWFVRL